MTRHHAAGAFPRALRLLLAMMLVFGLAGANLSVAAAGPDATDTTVAPDPQIPSGEFTATPSDEPSGSTDPTGAPEPGPVVEPRTPVIQPAGPVEPSIAKSVDLGPYRIGDEIETQITVTIPAGLAFTSCEIVDAFNRAGVYYIPGSAKLMDVSGNPDAGAEFAAGSTPERTQSGGDAQYTWQLADTIDNSSAASDYVFELSFDVQYTGARPNGRIEVWPALPKQNLKDTASFSWGDSLSGTARVAFSEPSGGIVFSGEEKAALDQPLIVTQKMSGWMVNNALALPGQYIPFIAAFANVGYAPAYDVTLDDVLPAELERPMILIAQQQFAGGGGMPLNDVGSVVTDTEGMQVDFEDMVLEPGDSVVLLYMVWVTPGTTMPSVVENVADIDWSSMPGNVAGERVYDDQAWEEGEWTDDTAAALSLVGGTSDSKISIVKEIVGDQDVFEVGDEIQFDITISNVGTDTIGSLPIMDQFSRDALELVSIDETRGAVVFDGIIEWEDILDGESLAPGESIELRTTYEAVGARGSAKNRVFLSKTFMAQPNDLPDGTANATAGNLETAARAMFPEIESNLAIVEFTIVDPGDLRLTKSANPAARTIMLPGETISYSIAFGNEGPDMPNVVVSDPVPDAVEYVPGSIRLTQGSTTTTITDSPNDADGGYDSTSDTVFVRLASLDTSDTGTLTFDVRVRPAEQSKAGVCNMAYMYVQDAPVAESNDVMHPVDPIDIFKSGKDINGGRLVSGDEILWTITVVNTGISPTTHVVVRDTVPTHTTYVSGSMKGLGANAAGDPDLVWDVGTLPVGGTAVLTFKSRVDADTPNGTQVSNQATVESDQSLLKVSDDASTGSIGDPTLLQTGGNDWIWLSLVGLALVGGVALTRSGRLPDERYRRPRYRAARS